MATCRRVFHRAGQRWRQRTTAAPWAGTAARATPAADAPTRRTTPVESTRQAPLRRPETLGRYRLDRQLGSGSLGVVYLGHDPGTGQPVAIKTLALGREFDASERADARAGLSGELAMAARLHHPDIVRVLEAGEIDGVAFIAMDYVAGGDLAAHAVAGRLLPVASVLAIGERVARALAHAHRQGVVHRDIKPANLLLVDASRGAVKVTDFGIARIADAHRTRTGLVLGSPSFMSPEQLAGRRLDGRTDLYSLGVVLFQLLTGALPHRSESIGRLLHDIGNQAAPDVRSLRPELPEALANVVALALEKRPALRYADGLQMADDLAAVARLMKSADAHTAAPPGAAAAQPTPASDALATRAADTGSATTSDVPRLDPRHNSGFP